jgi:hypothetical protein
MGRLTTLERTENNAGKIHKIFYEAKYKIFDAKGSKYMQIDTMGSKNRENLGKISQSIQFDKQFAKELVSILIKEFGD